MLFVVIISLHGTFNKDPSPTIIAILSIITDMNLSMNIFTFPFSFFNTCQIPTASSQLDMIHLTVTPFPNSSKTGLL